MRVNAVTVKQAMEDELARSMKELRMGDDEPHPYYIAYTVSDVDQATTSATLGSVTAAHAYRGRLLRTEVRVGDANFDNSNFEGGASVEAIPIEDDYAALRRELWLRSDEAYKSAVETLARKRSAASGQASADEDDGIADFSPQAAVHVEVPFSSAAPDPEALRETVRKLSLLLASFPEIYGSHVIGTAAVARRRLATSEGTWVDDNQRTIRIDVIADTQADDGMKLRSFVPFSALDVAGLPPFAEMEKSVRAMAKELVALRHAPVATSGAGAVLFEGPAAAQIVKVLLGDQLGGTPPPKTASAGSDDGGQQSVLAGKLGQRVAAPTLSLVDDPLLAVGPGKAPMFGSYRVDDEGVPAERVSLIEKGVLKSLLMSRTPRKELTRSNGHGRAPRFAGVRAHVGTLVLTSDKGQKRADLLAALGKIAKGGGVTTYIVRLMDDGSVPGEADDLCGAVLVRRRQPRAAAHPPAGGVPRRERQGDAGARRDPGEPVAPLVQGSGGHRQRAHRLQLSGRRRRILGGCLDHRRARLAVSGRRRPAPDGQAPETTRVSVAARAATRAGAHRFVGVARIATIG